MKIASDFYVRKTAKYRGGVYQDVTLHACGENLVEPADELVNNLGSPSEGFQASGVILLRVTNVKLAEAFRPGTVFRVVLEEKVGAVSSAPEERKITVGCPA